MSFTRFHYDKARTQKRLQELTGPGRWVLNTPGQGMSPLFYEDPHMRLEKWGGNVYSNPIDVSSDLQGRNKILSRDVFSTTKKALLPSNPISYPNMKSYTSETRVSHPVSMYRDKEQTRWEYPLLDPQEPIMYAPNTESSRILQKTNFVPKL